MGSPPCAIFRYPDDLRNIVQQCANSVAFFKPNNIRIRIRSSKHYSLTSVSYIDDFVVQIWNYQDGFTQLWLRTDGCRSHGEASEVGGFNPLSISSFVLDSSILSMGSTYISNISYLIHSRLCKYISTQSPSQEVDNCTWPAELRGCQSILLQSEKCHKKYILLQGEYLFFYYFWEISPSPH